MGESNDRLKLARERAGYRSARAAAFRFGWVTDTGSYSTYASHENGQTPVPPEDAKEYARAFRVTSAWILTGEGQSKNRSIVSVRGRIGAGAEISPEEEQVPEEGLEEIEISFPVPDDAIAFEVVGESQWPRYDTGDVIVCRNRHVSPDELIGIEAAVKTSDGKRYLKRIIAGHRKGVYDLESHNAKAIKGVRIDWCSEVHVVVRAGQWRRLKSRAAKASAGSVVKPRR